MSAFFHLCCSDKQTGKGEWEFQAYDNGLNVINPDGIVVCWFSHAVANERFALPSFWRSVKRIEFTTDRGTVIPFDPDPEDVRIVRQYLDDALLSGGVEALKGLRNKGLLGLVGGLGIVVACIGAMLLLDYGIYSREPGGRKRYGRPLIAGAIAGIALAGWGGVGIPYSAAPA